MRTLITLIIGIIIGAAGLFYGMKNGMVKLKMDGMETSAEAHKPHAQAAPAPQAQAAPAIEASSPSSHHSHGHGGVRTEADAPAPTEIESEEDEFGN